MESLARILAAHPFLEGMGQEHIEFITGCASNVVFNEGEFLYKQGSPVDKIYLLRHGRVAVQSFAPGRGPVTVDVATSGDLVGWSGLVGGGARFDVIALELVRAIALDSACLRAKCDADPKLGHAMFMRVADVLEHRLESTRVQLLDMYASNH
ncbi:MAG TPA: cyclic nucleotide-binding domain-containing protein [Fimbriimonadaceae bacterium]|nr:cyclic nucleotide-binding domain-containing protein [Fimbriimonadaceae bacterium]